MAGRRKEEPQTNGVGKGKIKFRYTDEERTVQFSMENITGESVTEGLRSLANALAGQTLPAAPSRRLTKGVVTPPTDVIDREEAREAPEQEIPESEAEAENEAEETGDAPAKPKKVRKPKAPNVLATPVLTEAKVPLADFVNKKNAPDMMDKYAVIAVWYKQEFQITDINIDRIFTAFKFLGQESQLPTDIEKPLKNLTYVKKWFDKGKGAGNFTINWVGESEVTKMGAGATKA